MPNHPVLHHLLALTAVLSLGACGSKEFRLYPLEGPLSEIEPPLQIVAKASGAAEGSGELSFKLPDRVKCQGTWTALAPKVVSNSSDLTLTLRNGPGAKMGSTVESVPGVNPGEFYAVCSDNRRIQGNFVLGSGTTSGTGNATDTMGNTYKVLF